MFKLLKRRQKQNQRNKTRRHIRRRMLLERLQSREMMAADLDISVVDAVHRFDNIDQSEEATVQQIKEIVTVDHAVETPEADGRNSVESESRYVPSRSYERIGSSDGTEDDGTATSVTGTIHWLSTGGTMQQKTLGKSWEILATDVSKFELTSDGALWTLHEDNLSVA